MILPHLPKALQSAYPCPGRFFYAHYKIYLAVSKKIHSFTISNQTKHYKMSYKVQLIGTFHDKAYSFEYDDYGAALDKYKSQAIDYADYLSVMQNQSVTIIIIDNNGNIIKSLTIVSTHVNTKH
jgi:hypothetical protein